MQSTEHVATGDTNKCLDLERKQTKWEECGDHDNTVANEGIPPSLL